MIPKQHRKVSMEEKSTSNLKEMFVLTFDHPILLGRVNATPLMENSILSMHGLKFCVGKFTTIIRTDRLHLRMKLGGHHVKKISSNRKRMGFGINQIFQSCLTIVIHNGDHILSSKMGLVPIRPPKVNVNEFKKSGNM